MYSPGIKNYSILYIWHNTSASKQATSFGAIEKKCQALEIQISTER
jgi:hypothetical protein